MSTFINFRDLRAQLDVPAVLAHYGVPANTPGQLKYQGPCPLPTHPGESKKSSFSVDCVRGIWQCFGCKASGNVLDFAVRMEGLNPENGPDVRKTALNLRRKFVELAVGDSLSIAPPAPIPDVTEYAHERVNSPLEFTLKGLDQTHPAVISLGIKPNTVAHFGIGYCSRGSLKGRIAIPLHNPVGNLVGYAGRLPNASATTIDEPLYRFPASRERDGIEYRFDAGKLLYGAHSIIDAPVQKLIVAEELTLVWHLFELGVHAVALLTQAISSTQENLLHQLAAADGLVFVGRSVVNRAT